MSAIQCGVSGCIPTTVGCKHTNPAAFLPVHECNPPASRDRVLQWECGRCGRIWHPGQFGWVEVRGATA